MWGRKLNSAVIVKLIHPSAMSCCFPFPPFLEWALPSILNVNLNLKVHHTVQSCGVMASTGVTRNLTVEETLRFHVLYCVPNKKGYSF